MSHHLCSLAFHLYIVVLSPVGQVIAAVVENSPVVCIHRLDVRHRLFRRKATLIAARISWMKNVAAPELERLVRGDVRYRMTYFRYRFFVVVAMRWVTATPTAMMALLVQFRVEGSFPWPLLTKQRALYQRFVVRKCLGGLFHVAQAVLIRRSVPRLLHGLGDWKDKSCVEQYWLESRALYCFSIDNAALLGL